MASGLPARCTGRPDGSALERKGEIAGKLAFQPYCGDQFPFSEQFFDFTSGKAATFGDQSQRPNRNGRLKEDRDVDHLLIEVIPSTGVEAPGVVPVEGDAVAASKDWILEQFSGQSRVVVMQLVQ